jgi:hypothetical protein
VTRPLAVLLHAAPIKEKLIAEEIEPGQLLLDRRTGVSGRLLRPVAGLAGHRAPAPTSPQQRVGDQAEPWRNSLSVNRVSGAGTGLTPAAA